MTSIDDFRTAASIHDRRQLFVIGLTVLMCFVSFALAISFKAEIRSFLNNHFSEPVAEALRGLVPFPAVIVLIVGLTINERKAKRNEHLKCPHCGKMLNGMRSIVIATRNCGNCGRRVLAEPDT